MPRTKINFENKRQELLHAIWEILLKYGYEKTTLSVIIEELGISKGAFYHYFQSKEECADAAIAAYVSRSVPVLQGMDDAGECASVRLQRAILNGILLFHQDAGQDTFMNQPENAVFHQKIMIAFTKYLSPFYSSLIQEGLKNHEFETAFPLETAEMLLTLCNFYLDSDLFHWEPQSREQKINALEALANKALGTKTYLPFFQNREPDAL